MKLSVWYNTNLNKFYVSYRQTVTDFPIGYKNEFGHIHIQSIFNYENQNFYSRESYDIFLDNLQRKKSIPYKIGKQLDNIATWLMRRK